MKAYIFQAALICEDCASRYIAENEEKMDRNGESLLKEDSDTWPQGPYGEGGGEADCPQACDMCGIFLENPLTPDGRDYVAERAEPYQTGDGDQSWQEVAELAEADGEAVLGEWIRFYMTWGG